MHIGFLEHGRREPSLSTLLILAKTLELPVQELVDGLPVPKKRSRRGGRVGALAGHSGWRQPQRTIEPEYRYRSADGGSYAAY